LAEIHEAPDSFRGKTVILGGEIVETRNRGDATTLVILEKPLDVFRRPRDVDDTGGRFLARFPRYLDPVVFARGRLVTLAGVVSGEAVEPVGDSPYRYVVLDGTEIHLWPAQKEWVPSSGYRYPWWYEGTRGAEPW
jgi:outer membrane lipoprotein